MKLEGFFAGIKDASKALEKLKKAGFSQAFIDMNDHYNDHRNVQTNLVSIKTAPSLSDLTLGSGSHVTDSKNSPLTAVNPMASGMGKFDEIADFNCKVIADINDSDKAKAEKIIKEMGGTLDNPNIKKPKLNPDSDYALHKVIQNANKQVQE